MELNVEVYQIQSTVGMNLFYCFLFLIEEAEDLIFLSSIPLDDQPNTERVCSDNIQRSCMDYGSCSSNQSMSLYIF